MGGLPAACCQELMLPAACAHSHPRWLVSHAWRQSAWRGTSNCQDIDHCPSPVLKKFPTKQNECLLLPGGVVLAWGLPRGCIQVVPRWSIGAVCCELSWGRGLEHLPLASGCSMGFLTTWKLGTRMLREGARLKHT